MNLTTYKISLDVQKRETQVFLSAIRGDTNRVIEISLTDNGKPFDIAKGSKAIFTAVKPDDNFIYNDCTVNAEKNIIIYRLTSQTTAVSGEVKCQIKLIGADGGILCTPSFSLIIGDTLYNEEPILDSTEEFNVATNYVIELERRLSNVDADLAPAIVGTAKGTTVSLSDSANVNFRNLKIYGRSTQDGTPTPDAPVDIVSVGDDGNIAVTVNDDTIVLTTENGLRGVPVTDPSLATYTDASGQMWCADEIDLERGVYIQRVKTIEFDGTENWTEPAEYSAYSLPLSIVSRSGICTHFARIYQNDLTGSKEGVYLEYSAKAIIKAKTSYPTLAAFKALLAQQASIGKPVTIYYCFSTSIETPLSAEEIAAYKLLKTNYLNTTIVNDENAYMSAEYVIDTKTYIDKYVKNTSGVHSSVKLLASAWKEESSNLYSQVVSINGVTANSKVDLNPSVEQLQIFYNKDITFVTENDDGVVTVYCVGQKPTNDYTMQVTITEVIVNG